MSSFFSQSLIINYEFFFFIFIKSYIYFKMLNLCFLGHSAPPYLTPIPSLPDSKAHQPFGPPTFDFGQSNSLSFILLQSRTCTFLNFRKSASLRRVLACLLWSLSGAQFSLLSDVLSRSYSPLFHLSSLFLSSPLCLNNFLLAFLYLSELVLIVSVTCGTELGLFSGRWGIGI